jgi:GxxExxY protein
MMMERAEQASRITEHVLDAAMRVHTALGPGLLESAHESCPAFELEAQSMSVERQKALPIVYRDLEIECGYRLDLLVENAVVVELKSVEALDRVHSAQMLTYLRLSGHSIGLLITFNVASLKSGIRRVVLSSQHKIDGS